MIKYITAILIALSMTGCYCTSSKEILTIPYGHNIDLVTVKDGTVIYFVSHMRNRMDEKNTPKRFPIIEVVEEKEQSLYDKKVYVSDKPLI